MASHVEDEQPGLLTIQQVSRLLDVPTPTIRSWERRYGLPQASRTNAGHRRYSDPQVQALRRMRDAIARGQPAGEAAALAKTSQMRTLAAQPLLDAFHQAALQLDPFTITQTLNSAHTQLGLETTINDVLLPAMRQIGQDWRTGRCDVAHEHLTTETTRAWLAGITSRSPSPARCRQPIVLTCGPDDHHTLGLEALAALLRQRGEDCRLLGAGVPSESLSIAITQISPAAVVLVSQLPAARRAAVDTLHAATRTLHVAHVPDGRVFYAGKAFHTSQARQGVPGTYLGDDLARAADLITAHTTILGPAALS